MAGAFLPQFVDAVAILYKVQVALLARLLILWVEVS